MKNPYLDKGDIGFITIIIMAVIILLISSQSIFTGNPTLDTEADVEARTRPVGQVRLAVQAIENQDSVIQQDKEENSVVQANDIVTQDIEPIVTPATSIQGEDIAKASCFTCHQHGLMNAPKIGDREDWGKRFAQGFDSLLTHALSGFNDMPARGGNPNLKDNEIEQALLFMLAQSELTVPGKTIVSVPILENESEKTASTTIPEESPEDDRGTDEPLTSSDAEHQPDENKANPDNETIQEQKTESLTVEEEAQQPIVADQSPGKESYNSLCASCHKSGSDKAPMTGKQEAWLQSFSKGIDALTTSIKQGPPSHPQISETGITDEQITNAINYIMQQTFWP